MGKKTLYFLHIPKCAGTSVFISLYKYFENELKDTYNGIETYNKEVIYWYKFDNFNIKKYIKNRKLIFNEEPIFNSFNKSLFNYVLIIRHPIDRFLSHLNMLYINNKINDITFIEYINLNIQNGFYKAYFIINFVTNNADYNDLLNIKIFLKRIGLMKIFYLEDKKFQEKIQNYISEYFLIYDFKIINDNICQHNYKQCIYDNEEILIKLNELFNDDIKYYNYIIKNYTI